jgi:DNA-binding LacI/PurR family transcriptional regulator
VQLSYAFTDPYYAALLTGLTEVAERTGTGLVLLPFTPPVSGLDDDEVRESVKAVHRAVIDGAVADGLGDDHPAVRALAARGVPLVRSSDSAGGRCVLIDDEAAGRSIGQHLAGLGHRDVTVVVASPGEPGQASPDPDEGILYPYSRLRLAGIRAGLGAGARVRVVTGGRNAAQSGRAAAGLILGRRDLPSAVAADSDVLGLGVLAAARLRGLEPGRDLSVTGFDDLPAAEAAGLTTVRQPIREKGRLMGQMLLDPSFTERRVLLPTELVVRASTAAPRHGRTEYPDGG